MTKQELHVVTGAFGYTGKYIARRLLDAGHRVRTLTGSPRRANPFGGAVEVHPFNFEEPAGPAGSLRGAAVLYNTYWVRFNHRDFNFASAVDNTLKLFAAAKQAGVRRVVHVSITNPSEDSPLEYFRGKARLERALVESGLAHSILRPAVLFGGEDILVNNIAWALRRFPVMAAFGDGGYRLRPIHVEDFADLAVAEGAETGNRVIDAVGPESFTYRELIEKIGAIIGKRRPVIGLPPVLVYLSSRLMGLVLGDVMLTRDEIKGLMAGLLDTDSPATGNIRLTDWARENSARLGLRYARELVRRQDRELPYDQL